MTLVEIFSIIIIHWIADFIMQDEKWALGKSKNWSDLLLHTFTYSFTFFWGIACLILYIIGRGEDNFLLSISFAIITFIFHTATDYFTSRIVSKRFALEAPFNLKLDNNVFKSGDIIVADNKEELIVMHDYIKHNYNTYRVKLYNSMPNFGAFTIIGLDQVLHYIQLFGTYYLLVKM